MITLQVPEGPMCLGCMFLDVDFVPTPKASCKLFGQELKARYRYGHIEVESIKKCERCPEWNVED